METNQVPAQPSQPRTIDRAVPVLSEQHQAPPAVERRQQGRIDFIHPVKVITEDNSEFTMLSCNLSATGIRMVGTRCLLGQKVRVIISTPTGTFDSLVRILWTCPGRDGLVENGGVSVSGPLLRQP
jgi:hypothetical protein